MKLDKLRMLRLELANEFNFEVVGFAIYYFFDGRWNELDGSKPITDQVAGWLNRANHDPIAYHAPNSRIAWFGCASMGCAVSIEFPTSPQLGTRKRSRTRITEVLKRASNAYQVAHNPLTLLFARDAFRAKLEDAIKSMMPVTPQTSEIQATQQERTLAVLALDIDHFKQVNDSHGHLYGDQVLKTFGIRLERTAERLTAAGKLPIEIAIGHPSGEEFLVLITGSATKDQVVAIANEFRNAINGEPLPSEGDWSWLRDRDNLNMLVPPPLHERIITTSVGIAIHTATASTESIQDRASKLLDQADAALYRAKAAGRNQVIAFDDILSSCGRVLEQDVHTRIVAVDIGKNVGVAVGQEFKVFPPGFTGKKKFSISDGRTTRTIGTYPRYDVTRVTVFDVQPELSFAFISTPEEATTQIEVGSHLEAIPLGSIGHLLPRDARYLSRAVEGVRVGDVTPLQTFISAQPPETKPFAVVFRFSRADQYLKQYGPAALHAALARLYRDITASFHTAAASGILDIGSICIVGRGQVYNDSRVQAFVNDLAEQFPELGLVAGAFSSADAEAQGRNQPSLSSEHAIEFARYAASDYALSEASRLTHFSYAVAVKIIRSLRESKAYSQARADFDKLRTLGIESASVLNIGALTYTDLGQRPQAMEMLERAIQLEGAVTIFRTNYATIACELGEVDRPLRLLATLTDAQVVALKTEHPYGFVTYARLLAKARLAESPEFNSERFALIAEDALNLGRWQNSQASQVIAQALLIS
jgi:diguanylate cyclase (GGDEF)-like protein